MHDNKSTGRRLDFLSGEEGLSMIQIQNALQIEESQKVQDALLSLKEKYASPTKGIELVEYASRYKFVTKDFVYPFGQKLLKTFNIRHFHRLPSKPLRSLPINSRSHVWKLKRFAGSTVR